MTKWQTRQALYLLGLTGILYLFSCKSQDMLKFYHQNTQKKTVIIIQSANNSLLSSI